MFSLEKIRKEFKHLNKKFLFAIFIGIFLPFAYGFLRVLFIVDHGANSYAMASYWAYIQIFLEIATAFLILPLFTYSKKHQSKKSFTILISVLIVVFFLYILLMTLTNPLLNSMEVMNDDPSISRKMLRNFLWLSMASNVLIIYEQFLMADVIAERNNVKVYIFTALTLFFKIGMDILFLAPFSPIEYKVNNIALSSMISSIIIIGFLQLFWFISFKRDEQKFTFIREEMQEYYMKGLVPGLEVLIRNFFYAFVTLKIVNSLGETQWNSWHLAGWVYWNLLFKFTIMLQYFLLSERINNDKIDSRKLTYLFAFFDLIIFLIVGPISIIFILPLVVDDSAWLDLTTKTAWIMLPFMYMIAFEGKMKTKFLAEDKLKYILINTIIVNLFIEFPIFIALLLGVQINYTWNLIIWMVGVSSAFFIAWYQFEIMERGIVSDWMTNKIFVKFKKENNIKWKRNM